MKATIRLFFPSGQHEVYYGVEEWSLSVSPAFLRFNWTSPDGKRMVVVSCLPFVVVAEAGIAPA